jgi:hypothetical protein
MSEILNCGSEGAEAKPLRWRPEDMLLTWIRASSWEEIAADADERAVEAYRALELSVRLHDAFTAPKLRELVPRLGEEEVLKLLGYCWVRYQARGQVRVLLPAQLRQQAQFLLVAYPLESIKDFIYAFYKTSTPGQSARECMTDYLEWKSQKLEEWHRSISESAGTLPDWLLQQCPSHWIENRPTNEAIKNGRRGSTDQAA